MKKPLHSFILLIIIMSIGFVSCKKDETIEDNKEYLDFLKDKSILDIQIVDNTKYIKSLKPCQTCGPREHDDTVHWTIVKKTSYEVYLDSDFIGVPQKDSKGNFYVGTYKSLYKSNESGRYEIVLNTDDFYFRYFTIDKLDNIWFYGDNAGIAYWDHSKLTVYNSHNSILPADYFCKLVVDSSNAVWVASIGSIGLIKIESGNWMIIPGSEIPGFTENSYLNFPLVDNENGIWFEVYNSNVDTKYVRLKDNTWTLKYLPNSQYTFSRLIKDSRNIIWLFSYTSGGNENGGLWYYKENTWNNIEIGDLESKISTVNADDKLIYIGTQKGLYEKSR